MTSTSALGDRQSLSAPDQHAGVTEPEWVYGDEPRRAQFAGYRSVLCVERARNPVKDEGASCALEKLVQARKQVGAVDGKHTVIEDQPSAHLSSRIVSQAHM
jgi:hypothetical protein